MSNPLHPELMSTAERPEEAARCLGRPDSHRHPGLSGSSSQTGKSLPCKALWRPRTGEERT